MIRINKDHFYTNYVYIKLHTKEKKYIKIDK